MGATKGSASVSKKMTGGSPLHWRAKPVTTNVTFDSVVPSSRASSVAPVSASG